MQIHLRENVDVNLSEEVGPRVWNDYSVRGCISHLNKVVPLLNCSFCICVKIQERAEQQAAVRFLRHVRTVTMATNPQ